MSLPVSAFAIKIGEKALREFVVQIRIDRRNRYILNADFTLPALTLAMPFFEDEALLISGKRVTIKRFAGANDCDGNTLSPDKWRGKLLFGFIPHDRIYSRLPAIAKAWGVSVAEVRRWADDMYYAIMDAQGVPRWVSWSYFQGVRKFGGIWLALTRILGAMVLALTLAGCGGCASPPSNFFENPDELTEPDTTKTAALHAPNYGDLTI